MEIKGKILYVSEEYYLYSKGLTIYKASIQNKTSTTIFMSLPVGRIKSFLSGVHLLERLFRLSVHHVVPDQAGGFYILYDRSICRVNTNGKVIGNILNIRGGRPLCVCVKDRELYYGEYHNNLKRLPMSIFKYDGVEDFLVCTFDDVRHIHGVFNDPFSNHIYVTTGDCLNEAAIWKVDKAEKIPVTIGGQQSRAVQLLFTQESIYFSTDTPLEKNYIYKIDKNTNIKSRLGVISSSVFYGVSLNGKLYFSTVVEPSEFNSTRSVELWRVQNDIPEIVGLYKKDFWSMRYFQYGQLMFPNYSEAYSLHDLWIYKQGVVKSGFSIRLKDV